MADPPQTPYDPVARFYDQDYRQVEDDLPLILELAQETGGPLLELGCGSGRVLLPAAAVGLACTGVDSSLSLLAIARRKIQQANLQARITLVAADMGAFDLGRTDFQEFGCACWMSNTFMHLTTPEEQLAALIHVHRHLRPGGSLLIDLFNPDIGRLIQVHGLQELADSWIDAESGAIVHKWIVRTLNLAEQLQDTLIVYEELYADGRVHRTPFPFTLRFLWRHEGELMLAKAGFHVAAVWGDAAQTPYADGSERLIFWARKTP